MPRPGPHSRCGSCVPPKAGPRSYQGPSDRRVPVSRNSGRKTCPFIVIAPLADTPVVTCESRLPSHLTPYPPLVLTLHSLLITHGRLVVHARVLEVAAAAAFPLWGCRSLPACHTSHH
jgi:hypothetical protein